MEIEHYRRANIQKEIAFSDAEYQQRIARVRAQMERNGLDILLVHHLPNVCYLTGFQTPMSDWYACVVIPSKGDIQLQVCDMPLAVLTSNIQDIRNTRWDQMSTAANQLADLLSNYDLHNRRVGMELRKVGLNAHTYTLIAEKLKGAKIVDASDLVSQIRAVKSIAEIACVRQAGQFSVAGIEAAYKELAPGITENRLAAVGAAAMINAGSEFFSIDPFVRAGQRSGFLHASFKRGFVKAGDPIVVEFAGVYQRYSAPIYATLMIGRPSDEIRRMVEFCLEMLELLYANVRAGRTINDVASPLSKRISSIGPDMELNRDRHGYSVGIGFPPDWVEHSINLTDGNETVLEPRMVFHTPRSLRIPGVLSVAFSETILVTETGCEILTPHERKLFLT